MSDQTSSAEKRLEQIKDNMAGKKETALSVPWDPKSTSFPLLKDLPAIEGAPEGASWFWGENDYIGRLNLITPERIKAAAASEIKTGEMTRLDLPLHIPEQPAFKREVFNHSIKTLLPGVSYDDIYHLNTQSGTQWDGFRHFAHMPTKTFYNNTKPEDFANDAGTDNLKCSIHHWTTHGGIIGRAVLLDYRTWAHRHNKVQNTSSAQSITLAELEAVGKEQGIDIRPASQGGDIQVGDILLIRSGWIEDHYARDPGEAQALGLREIMEQYWTGVEQSEEMKTWLHDCYFAAVGGDSPTFERWPTLSGYYLHEHILTLWGMPLGEMLDLEKATEICQRLGRWAFFLTSAPANCVGGVSE